MARWCSRFRARRNPGAYFEFVKKGLPVRGGAAGGSVRRVVIETPVGLGAEQKEMLRKFEATLSEGSHSRARSSFFHGVKKFLHRRTRLGFADARVAALESPDGWGSA